MSKPIITMTVPAIEHIGLMLEQDPEKNIFHLSVKSTGCNGYMYVPSLLSSPCDTDEKVKIDTPFGVYISQDAVTILQGTVIHFEEKSFGMKQLTFQNPNAAGTCGCGESFNLDQGKNSE